MDVYFDTLLKQLSDGMVASNIGFPNCYKNNTFWAYPKSPYLPQHVFEKKNITPKPNSLKLYKPLYLYGYLILSPTENSLIVQYVKRRLKTRIYKQKDGPQFQLLDVYVT